MTSVFQNTCHVTKNLWKQPRMMGRLIEATAWPRPTFSDSDPNHSPVRFNSQRVDFHFFIRAINLMSWSSFPHFKLFPGKQIRGGEKVRILVCIWNLLQFSIRKCLKERLKSFLSVPRVSRTLIFSVSFCWSFTDFLVFFLLLLVHVEINVDVCEFMLVFGLMDVVLFILLYDLLIRI